MADIDKKAETSDATATGRPAVASARAPHGPDFGVEAFYEGDAQTKGEKKFDLWAYWVNGFAANLLLSAFITYGIKDNFYGQKFYRQLDKGYEYLGVADPGQRATLTNALSLLMGGHVTAIGIKKAEDHKLDIVRWLDKKEYGENAEETPEIRAAHARIAEETAPTWLGIASARLTCALTIQAVAAAVGNENSNRLMNYGKRQNIAGLKNFSVEGYSRVAAEHVVKSTPAPIIRGFNKLFSPLATHDSHLLYGKILTYSGMDVFYTAISAGMLKPVLEILGKIPGMRHFPSAGMVTKPDAPVTNPDNVPADPKAPVSLDRVAQSEIVIKPEPEPLPQPHVSEAALAGKVAQPVQHGVNAV